MKRIFSILLLPLVAVIMFVGCKEKYTIDDVMKAYSNMIASQEVDGENLFFISEENPNAIVISYPSGVKEAVENKNPSNDIQKRYRALYYQQEILDNIFDYYNKYQENFYRIVKSKDLEQDTINDLYNSVKNINDTLNSFKEDYDTFVSATKNGISDVMEFNLTSYSYELNKVIDASFNFVNKVKNIYVNECIEDYSIYNSENLNSYVDVAYLDISYVIYLENIKAFNYSVGDHGICDLADIVGSENKYNLLKTLEERKSISLTITENIGQAGAIAKEMTDRVNLFVYTQNVFNQRFTNYLSNYNSLDMYTINQYRFDLVGSIDYDSYLNSLSASKRATVLALDNFVTDNFVSYISKLSTIVE